MPVSASKRGRIASYSPEFCVEVVDCKMTYSAHAEPAETMQAIKPKRTAPSPREKNEEERLNAAGDISNPLVEFFPRMLSPRRWSNAL